MSSPERTLSTCPDCGDVRQSTKQRGDDVEIAHYRCGRKDLWEAGEGVANIVPCQRGVVRSNV